MYRHARGKTVSELDNVLITNLVLNTAEPHFNEHVARAHPMFGQRIVFGGVTIAMVIGLAAQDTAAHAVAELGMRDVKLFAPVYHGDTLYAYTTVLAAEPEGDGATGIVTFQHQGFNQHDRLVFAGVRRTRIMGNQ